VAAVTVAGSDAESGVSDVVAAGMFVVLPQAPLAKTRIKVIQKIEQGFVIRFLYPEKCAYDCTRI
jgi:hypothetical protein